MKRSAFSIERAPVTAAVALFLVLALVAVGPAVVHSAQMGTPTGAATEEPTPRFTPESEPFIQLNPTEGIAGERTRVVATGAFWEPEGNVVLYWDSTDNRVSNVTAAPDGTIQTAFETPVDPPFGSPGAHTVIAVQGDHRAQATFMLVAPTPTNTPTMTWTPLPSATPTPITPTSTRPATSTFTPTPTFTPSPTLRPVTPMVTITPIPPTAAPPGPVRTSTPAPTRTNTPLPGTLTFTPTPSITPTPSQTPGPGTPSATPEPSATATATAPGEISDTGSGGGIVLLWGFVLAGLLVVFRLLRIRGLPGSS